MIVCLVAGGGMVMTMCVCAGLLLPAVQAAREAARRMSCSNNMRQISIGLHNYHSAYGTLPPAYTTDDQGRRLHSWRTLILPFVEQQALYEQIDLSKPWDDPVNRPYALMAPDVYRCPSFPDDSGQTLYVAVVHPQGAFEGSTPVRFEQITDGLADTILFVECERNHAVSWMSPDDIDLQTITSTGSGGQHSHVGGGNASLADGAVRFLTDSVAEDQWEAMVTRDGEEEVSPFAF